MNAPAWAFSCAALAMLACGSFACSRTLLDGLDAGRALASGSHSNTSASADPSARNTPVSSGRATGSGGPAVAPSVTGSAPPIRMGGGAGAAMMPGRSPDVNTEGGQRGVPCGKTYCTSGSISPVPGLMLAEWCCVNPVMDQCGWISYQTNHCEGPPPPAPKCPKVFNQPGCCAAGNVCGFDASMNGRGCLDPSMIAAMIPAQFRSLLMLPPPAHCDGSPIVALDGGVSDFDASR